MKKIFLLSLIMFAFGYLAMAQSEVEEKQATQTAEKVSADKKYATAKMNTKVITKREAEVKEASKKSNCGSKSGKKACCSSKKGKADSESKADDTSKADAEEGGEMAQADKKSCCSKDKKAACSGKKGKALKAKEVKQ